MSSLYGEDLRLAAAALAGHPASQEVLRGLVEREVKQAVRHAAAHLADEVSQVLFSRLLVGEPPKLREYSGRGPIGAWLRASALGLALNLRRQERPAVDEDGFSSEDLRIASSDPEVDYMRSLCNAEFDTAFTHAMATLEVKERNLIRLRFLDALTLEELAAYFRVHRATIVRWLAEVTERLFIETRRELSDRLALERPEIDSLLRAARSRIDFTLSGLLRRAQ